MADADGYCEGDSCPPSDGTTVIPLPPPNCTSLQYVILVTTGVTCVALLLDLAKRYLFTSNATDKSTLTDGEIVAHENGYTGGLKVGFGDLKSGREKFTKTTVTEVTSSAGGYEERSRYQGYDAVDNIIPSYSKPLHTQTIHEVDEDRAVTGRAHEDRSREGGSQELGHMLDDLMTALRTSVHSEHSSQDMPGNCKDNAAKLASLESLFVSLGKDVDGVAMDMVSAPTEDDSPQNLEALSKIEKETAAYKKCWLGLRRLLFCVDIHLRNSTHYQVFHHECDRLQTAIEKYLEQLKSKEQKRDDEDISKMSVDDLKAAIQDMEKIQAMLKLWGDAIARLCDQSKTIHPVHLRTEELSDQVAARAVCNYHTDKTTVKEGDIMLLLDNSDSDKWKLSNTSGEELELPAVCCEIPAPDINTMKTVGRIESCFKELSEYVENSYSDKMTQFVQRLLLLISTKDFKSITPEQRKELLAQMTFLEVFLRKLDKDGQYKDVLDKFTEIRTKVSNLEDNGADEAMEELMSLFTSWQKVANMYESSVYDKEKRKMLVKQGIILDAEETEWETLAEIEEARRELGLAVSVQRETMTVGEATKYESATGETRQTFSITGVIDPRDDTELSMDEAIKRGIIDQNNGIYQNLKTGESYPIPVAMGNGLIIVSATKTTKARELKKEIGVITVEFTRETRPYKITHVMDSDKQEQIPIADAMEQGIFDADRQLYKNTESGEEMTVENAIDSGFLIVEYDEEAEVSTKPVVTKKSFTISSVLDRKSGKSYKFDDAVERRLIDKEAGMYLDTKSGQKINIVEAVKMKLIKGRVVADPDKIDAAFIRQRSGSVDSQTSESSKLGDME